MAKSSVETYTISSDPIYSPSSLNHTPHMKIPNNGKDIKIIITEPTPTEYDTPNRIHVVESNPTYKRTLTRIPTHQTMPTYEIVETPPSHRTNISRDLSTDYSNTSVTNWIMTEKSSATNSLRYTGARLIHLDRHNRIC
jgi:hypothetical protein